MVEQARDFKEESEALYRLIEPLTEEDFERKTQFKGWSINDILGHLHIWNWAADLTLKDTAGFEAFLTSLVEAITSGSSLREFEMDWLKELKGKALLDAWYQLFQQMSANFEAADPKKRLKWIGPEMSVRSKITARLMETWAHGQGIYDLLGIVREEGDRIKNIAQLGVSTFGWTFINRQMTVPEEKPYVLLTAPSGAKWEWNTPSEQNRIEGDAREFCQVVTQVRNIADTSLQVTGEAATQWMSIAQCFAGPPEDPPKAGSRFRST